MIQYATMAMNIRHAAKKSVSHDLQSVRKLERRREDQQGGSEGNDLGIADIQGREEIPE